MTKRIIVERVSSKRLCGPRVSCLGAFLSHTSSLLTPNLREVSAAPIVSTLSTLSTGGNSTRSPQTVECRAKICQSGRELILKNPRVLVVSRKPTEKKKKTRKAYSNAKNSTVDLLYAISDSTLCPIGNCRHRKKVDLGVAQDASGNPVRDREHLGRGGGCNDPSSVTHAIIPQPSYT